MKMQTSQSFELINGEFTLEEARELLTNLYADKVKFHELKNFSSNERFGTNDVVAEKRIPELKADIEAIKSLLGHSDIGNSNVQINASIQIVIR